MPDARDEELPGNVVWLGREIQLAIAGGLRDWWEELLDEEIPEHLLRILDGELPDRQAIGASVIPLPSPNLLQFD